MVNGDEETQNCNKNLYFLKVPPMIDYTMKGRTYRYYEGTPLYPFGYGLSYTSFKYSNLSIRPQRAQAGENVTVSVTLTNTGSFDADEVIVYLSNMFKSSWRLSSFFF